MHLWWEKTVFYQIYMSSFCDGNGDGLGDFKGIASKLDYLKKLGIGCIWLTPFYPSPKVDQGYDISDYYDVDPQYGTLQEFQNLIQQAHARGIRVIADMVMNHTSSEHKWFQESKSSRDSEKRDWYVWHSGIDGRVPNNWESFFGGSAWEWDEGTQQYYYHSFAKEQVDLNWQNPEVQKEMFRVLDFWVEQGVDGFRLDVINNLTLTDELRDNPVDETGKQIHLYDENQTGIKDIMKRLRSHFSPEKQIFFVGEISSDQLNVIHSYAEDDLLNTTFNFNLGSQPRFDFNIFFEQLKEMSRLYKGENLPTIFFGSHDMQRFPDRFQFNEAQIRNLFTLMMTYRALPFIYFGDELGMRNFVCHSIEEARDVQGVLAYHRAVDAGKTPKECLDILNQESRDHSRNTMIWSNESNGGFSTVTPWIPYQPQPIQPAFAQQTDPDSLFSFVAKLVHCRTTIDALAFGDVDVQKAADQVLFCKRSFLKTTVYIWINFSQDDFRLPETNGKILVQTGKNALRRNGGLWLSGQSSVVLLDEESENTN